MLNGRILAESLRGGHEIAVSDLRLTRVSRVDVTGSAGPDQPPVWTMLDVAAPDDAADELAAALAAALDAQGGWYADFRVGAEHVVVFAGRIFRYAVGDDEAREAVVAYGRRAGVPEHQLDWG